MEDSYPDHLIYDLFSKRKLKVLKVEKLKGDVSSRQYFRVHTDVNTFIAAIYPEEIKGDLKRYISLTNIYRENKINVPELYFYDLKRGISILEDLGDKILYRDEDIAREYLDEILEILKKIREIDCKLQFKYILDREKLLSELNFFKENFSRYKKISFNDKVNSEINKIVDRIVNFKYDIFCHRDFMVRNLMLKDDKIFVIDFQDSTYGPYLYDIASFLNDSISLEYDKILNIFQQFLNLIGEKKSKEMEELFIYTSIQRLLKALGTFSMQLLKGNNDYLSLFEETMEKVRFYLNMVFGKSVIVNFF